MHRRRRLPETRRPGGARRGGRPGPAHRPGPARARTAASRRRPTTRWRSRPASTSRCSTTTTSCPSTPSTWSRSSCSTTPGPTCSTATRTSSTPGRRCEPNFKPDFNPELLLGQNCLSHLGVYRTRCCARSAGCGTGVEGSQDHDLALRVVEPAARRVRHVPYVLYHWRQWAGSGTFSSTQPRQGRRGLPRRRAGSTSTAPGSTAHRRALARTCPRGTASRWPVPARRRGHRRRADPRPGRAAARLPRRRSCTAPTTRRCGCWWSTTTAPTRRRSTTSAGSRSTPASRCCTSRRRSTSRALNNVPSSASQTDCVLLLNNDIVVREPGWLTRDGQPGRPRRRRRRRRQAAVRGRPGPARRASCSGVGGVANHAHRLFAATTPATSAAPSCCRRCPPSRAPACSPARELYLGVGGLDEVDLAVAFNDVDFCLRVREAGSGCC